MTSSNDSKKFDFKTIAPEFANLTQDLLFGDIWKRPGLSLRDKCLVTVSVLTALNRIEEIDFYLNKALENGITKEELIATITHIAFYAGWPAAVSGILHLKGILDKG